MKRVIILSTLAAAFAFSAFAQADLNNSLSAGYAYGKAEDLKLKGFELKYRYEWDSPISVISSFVYMKDTKDSSFTTSEPVRFNTSNDVKYYSLNVGPAYRINEFVSAYGLVGLSRTKFDLNTYNTTTRMSVNDNTNSTNFAYGVGVQVNPIPNLVLDVAYQGSKVKGTNDYSTNLTGFTIGAGYRF